MKTTTIAVCIVSLIAFVSCGPVNRQSTVYDGDEQINIGYGSVARKDLMGAVSKIDMDKEKAVYSNIYDYLRGTVAGLQVGPGNTITIRGIHSLNGSNEPLILVDGMEVSDLSSIAPETVKSVEILKDAVYTAAYGSRGANGVILIKLK